MVSLKKVLMVFIFAIALFGILNTAKADLSDIVYGINVINDKARPNERLEYNVTIQNNGLQPISLSLNVLFTGVAEITPSVFTLEPKEEKNVYVALTIKPDQKPGKVLIKLLVFDDKGNSLEPPIFLQGEILESPQPYKAVKISKIIVPESLDPRKPFSISFDVNNPVKTTTATLEIVGEDGFEIFKEDNYVVEEGINTITIENLTLPSDTAPWNYTLSVKLIFSPDVISEGRIVASVLPYSTCDIKESEKVSLFGKTYSAEVKNSGTETTNCVVTSRISGIEKALMTTVTQGYEFKDGEIRWEITVQPGTEKVVQYQTNYVPLLLIPFAIIIIVGGAWYFTRKVTIKKELVDYKRHPGFMDLKIQLRIKNLSGSELRNVKIYDPLPAFIKEVRDYGTIPGKVTRKAKQRVVLWELEKINPKEERVVSYKVRTSLEVLGKVLFKPAKIEYKDEKGMKQEEASNVLALEIE